ncbi:unnamed protein product, partial [Cylicocyclus nassatus]
MGARTLWHILAMTISVVSAIDPQHQVTATAPNPKRIAVIGEGVIGLSTALAIKEHDPAAQITIFHDRPFENILSRGIAGLFRIDEPTPIQ